jgi:hypothetical protein
MADSVEFWFPGDVERLASDAGLREAWAQAYNDAVRALSQFDADRQPHAIELEVVEIPARGRTALPEFCENVLGALQRLGGATGEGSGTMRWLTQVHATMRLAREGLGVRLRVRRAQESAVQPAGTLLVDLRYEMSADPTGQGSIGGAPSGIWIKSIGDTLEQNPLARVGAEYAMAIDLPLEPGMVGREALIGSSFQVMGQVAAMLPTKRRQTSTLPELWLTVLTAPGESALQTRLRIWRLGFMKVEGQPRMA